MSVRSAIYKAVPLLARHGPQDAGILLAWLLREGLSRYDADRVIRFVPLAFGREILQGSGVTLSDTYVRIQGEQREERPLAGEEFFREASALAPTVARNFGQETFTAIVFQSSEFHAVNNALNSGASPEYLVAGPPVIEWPEGTVETPREERKW